MSNRYYAEKLSGQRLDRVYAIAGARVRRYLEAEIAHVRTLVRPGDRVLELGCGTGRVLAALEPDAGELWGVDHALASVRLARTRHPACHWALMDAACLGFKPRRFDVVAGIQNFISACRIPPDALLRECLRVADRGGRIVLSSYAASFWTHRLKWFHDQADAGLLGAIDEKATGNGLIVGKNGFRATTFSRTDFADLARNVGVDADVYEVDGSSLFFRVTLPESWD